MRLIRPKHSHIQGRSLFLLIFDFRYSTNSKSCHVVSQDRTRIFELQTETRTTEPPLRPYAFLRSFTVSEISPTLSKFYSSIHSLHRKSFVHG